MGHRGPPPEAGRRSEGADRSGEPGTGDSHTSATTVTSDGRVLPSSPGAAPGPLLAAGTRLGRYVVQGELGRGGMGVVYLALDPELGRRVALKVLAPERIEGGSGDSKALSGGRLLREAQALAQLAHPNVVAVYDAGTHGDDVFVTMELLEGATLRRWLEDGPRSRREVLDVFLAAGRGLEAAHRAGLVHRDFKPDNVILARDGRPRVVDFGLAKPQVQGTRGEPSASAGGAGARGARGAEAVALSELTTAGSVLGTPVYMAPEQMRAQEVDARADQYAFAVALFEALYGARPFQGRTLTELRGRAAANDVTVPEGRDVPPWLLAVLRRGLRWLPDERFPSMGALLAAIESDPDAAAERLRAERRKRAAWASVGAMVAVVPLALWAFLSPRPAVCAGGDDHLRGLWDEPQKDAVRAAFARSESAIFADTFQRVDRALSEYRAAWVTSQRQACEATRVKKEQSEELLDLRMACLLRAAGEARALVAELGRADADVVARATAAVRSLPPVDRCADREELMGGKRPPRDPSSRARLTEIEDRLAQTKALMNTGRYESALVKAKEALTLAETLQYEGALAAALLEEGFVQDQLGQRDEALATLLRAAQVADKAGRDRVRAQAEIKVFDVVGYQKGKLGEAHWFAELARGAVDRVRDADALKARFHDLMGNLLLQEGKLAEAAGHYEACLALFDGKPDVGVFDAHGCANNLAVVRWRQGEYEKARAILERDIAEEERVLGPEHPEVGKGLNNLSLVLGQIGDRAGAVRLLERYLVICEHAYGGLHRETATTLNNLGAWLRQDGQRERARPLLEQALAVREKLFGDGNADVADTLNELGNLELDEHHADAALALQRRALAVYEKAYGHEHRASAVALQGMGEALVAGGRGAEAVTALREALRIDLKAEVAPAILASLRFDLARALWLAGRERDQSLALAAEAQKIYEAVPTERDALARVRAWLSERAGDGGVGGR